MSTTTATTSVEPGIAAAPSTYNPYRRMSKARRAQLRRRLSMGDAGPGSAWDVRPYATPYRC